MRCCECSDLISIWNIFSLTSYEVLDCSVCSRVALYAPGVSAQLGEGAACAVTLWSEAAEKRDPSDCSAQ